VDVAGGSCRPRRGGGWVSLDVARFPAGSGRRGGRLAAGSRVRASRQGRDAAELKKRGPSTTHGEAEVSYVVAAAFGRARKSARSNREHPVRAGRRSRTAFTPSPRRCTSWPSSRRPRARRRRHEPPSRGEQPSGRVAAGERERPRRDLNPRYRRERPPEDDG